MTQKLTIEEALAEAWIAGFTAPGLSQRNQQLLAILQKLQKKSEFSNDEKGEQK